MFRLQSTRNRPSLASLIASVCVHGAAIAGLLSVSFLPPPPPAPKLEAADQHPTEIRIGDHVYFVTEISSALKEIRRTENSSKKAAAKAAAARAKALAAEGGAKLLNPPTETVASAAPPKPAPRVFVPPQVKENLISESTLIQPAYPADLIPKIAPLPSFRVWTAQKLPPPKAKPFVEPGRPKPPQPQAVQVAAPPDMEMVHADPQPPTVKAALVLPATPPPIDIEKLQALPTAVPSTRQGDPVNILSLSDRPIAPTDKLVVPAGNIVGKTGVENGTGSAASLAGTAVAAGGSSAANNGTAPGANNGPGSGATNLGSGISVFGSGAGRSPGASRGAPGSASGTLTAGLNGAGTARTTGNGAPGNASGTVVTPKAGNFDMVVIQSSSLDQFPGGKDMLSGRPIYSVYISIGSSKDWTLFFCVPGQKSGQSVRGEVIVDSTQSAPPIKAPFPTRLVRPSVTIPSFFKYVLVHGYVTETGRFDRLKVVKASTPDADQAILASLAGWEFHGATKDGVAIPVEILLSIPVSGL